MTVAQKYKVPAYCPLKQYSHSMKVPTMKHLVQHRPGYPPSLDNLRSVGSIQDAGILPRKGHTKMYKMYMKKEVVQTRHNRYT